MIVTDDEKLYARIESLRNHGASVSVEQKKLGAQPHLLPDFDLLGHNSRLTDLQAAIGIVQLGKLDRFIEERDWWARYYIKQFAKLDWLQTPALPKKRSHAWQAFVCMVDEDKAGVSRDEIMKRLKDKGIGTRPGTLAVHMLGYYRKTFGLKPEDFPCARDCFLYSMALPLHNCMSAEDYTYVAETVATIL